MPFRLRLRCDGRPPVAVTLPDDATLDDLLATALSSGFPEDVLQEIWSGVPPRKLAAPAGIFSPQLGVLGVQSGSVVDFRRGVGVVPALSPRPAAAAPAPPLPRPVALTPAPAPAPATWTCSLCTLINEAGAGACGACDSPRPGGSGGSPGTGGAGHAPAPPPAAAPQPPRAAGSRWGLARHVVPADNSCLFAAASYLLSPSRVQDGPGMRARVVRFLATRPDVVPDALLDRPRDAYLAWLSQDTAWGGGLECLALAVMHSVEVCVLDIRASVPMVFGEGRGYPRRVLLLFDGLHYDAVHGTGSRPPTTMFPAGEESVLREGLALAAAAKAAGDFTDPTRFTLQCLACGAGLEGAGAAQAHARANPTHINFSEYRGRPGGA